MGLSFGCAQGGSERQGLERLTQISTTPTPAVVLLPFPYVILDLEIMGGTPLYDRIIEIALLAPSENGM